MTGMSLGIEIVTIAADLGIINSLMAFSQVFETIMSSAQTLYAIRAYKDPCSYLQIPPHLGYGAQVKLHRAVTPLSSARPEIWMNAFTDQKIHTKDSSMLAMLTSSP